VGGGGGGGGASSFVIVPCPWTSAGVAPDGEDRLTRKDSLGSTSVSPLTVMDTVSLVSRGRNVTVPESD
jgi:hypothetical protein